jgi:hypothetical protein
MCAVSRARSFEGSWQSQAATGVEKRRRILTALGLVEIDG